MQRWRVLALAREGEAVFVCRRGLNAFIIIIYKETWTPTVGEKPAVLQKAGNNHDRQNGLCI